MSEASATQDHASLLNAESMNAGSPGPSVARRPVPAELTHLKPRTGTGLFWVVLFLADTVGGFWLSTRPSWAMWGVGQVLLAIAFTQWFVVLHEAGHGTLVRKKWLHAPIGHLASVFAGIPFSSWKLIHGQHHKWAGWQDLDPMTVALVPREKGRERGRAERAFLNVSWRLSLPMFKLVYHVPFWTLSSLHKVAGDRAERRALTLNVVLLALFYIAIIVAFGPRTLMRVMGLGVLLSMLILEPIMLSQHTHMPMKLAKGAAVRPFAAVEQEPFTRSLRFPGWFSLGVLLHFDAHELHHMYPWIAGYDLRRIDYAVQNEMKFLPWLWRVKRMRGEIFLLQTRLETGEHV